MVRFKLCKNKKYINVYLYLRDYFDHKYTYTQALAGIASWQLELDFVAVK